MTTENITEWHRLRVKFGTTSDSPGRIADRLLEEVGIIDRPHVKLYDIINKLGVHITTVEPDLGWYGQIEIIALSLVIISVKKEDTIDRQKFVVAHELGHLFWGLVGGIATIWSPGTRSKRS